MANASSRIGFGTKRHSTGQLEGERNKMLCVRKTEYEKITIYIIGDPRKQPCLEGTDQDDDDDGPPSPSASIDPHDIRITDAIDGWAKLWSTYGDHTVSMKWVTTGIIATDFIEHKLWPHKKGELVMVVYCGDASGEDEAYRWTFTGNPEAGFNAWELLRAGDQRCEADVAFIVDAFMQNRHKPPLKRASGQGNSEIFYAPAQIRGIQDGKTLIFHPGHLLESITRNLEKYVVQICRLCPSENIDHFFLAQVGFSLQSINQICAMDKIMYSNPQHYFYNRPYGTKMTEITRVKFNPTTTKASGKLTLCREEYQGPGQMKPKCVHDREIEWELAIWAQLLHYEGRRAKEWSESRDGLEMWHQLSTSFFQAGFYDLLENLDDYSELAFSGSRKGKPNVRMSRRGTTWRRRIGGGSGQDGDQGNETDDNDSDDDFDKGGENNVTPSMAKKVEHGKLDFCDVQLVVDIPPRDSN